MRRTVLWAVVCLLFALVLVGEAAAKGKKKKVAARKPRCVSAQQVAGDAEITWTFNNVCETEVSCVARWTFRCGDRPTENGSKEESLTLPPGDRAEVVASAAGCGDEWEIASPRWTCQTSVRAQK